MNKLQYEVIIQAPVSTVYDKMLGLSDKNTYEQWTAQFNPTSTYEGNWSKGSKIKFLGVDENGEKGGMVSEIHDLIPYKFVSIRHYGLVKGEEEITEGPEVDKWANGFENYSYEESNGGTKVTVDLDTTEEFVDYMNQSYPKALAELKSLCEQ